MSASRPQPARRVVALLVESRMRLPANCLPDLPAPTRPMEVWVADITCIRPADGWMYLGAIPDLYSRASFQGLAGRSRNRRVM